PRRATKRFIGAPLPTVCLGDLNGIIVMRLGELARAKRPALLDVVRVPRGCEHWCVREMPQQELLTGAQLVHKPWQVGEVQLTPGDPGRASGNADGPGLDDGSVAADHCHQ